MQVGAIDIGGTAIKYAIVNINGDIVYDGTIATKANLGGLVVVEQVLTICNELMSCFEIEGISISSAGQIDNVNGRVCYATDNIPGYTGLPIAEIIHNKIGLPVTVENDVNCTALGEYWKGAARGVDDFLCVTLGTGIGGSLFLNGELYTGANFSAGEFGHMTLYPGGLQCTCGSYGCYEKYASSSSLENLVLDAYGYPIDLRDFFIMTKQRDLRCLKIFDRWLDDLTTGLKTIVHIFNPSLIIIGGGISAQGEYLRQAIKTSLMKKVLPNHQRILDIKMAENNNKANLIGAAKHYFMTKQKG